MNFPLIPHIELVFPACTKEAIQLFHSSYIRIHCIRYIVHVHDTTIPHYFIALRVGWVLCVHRLSNGLQQLSDETIVVTSVDYRLQEEPQAAVREWERDKG